MNEKVQLLPHWIIYYSTPITIAAYYEPVMVKFLEMEQNLTLTVSRWILRNLKSIFIKRLKFNLIKIKIYISRFSDNSYSVTNSL